METRYNVILKGIHPGAEEQHVFEALSALFKIDHEKVKSILARPDSIIKANLPLDMANRYQAAVVSTGAICAVEENTIPAHLDFDLDRQQSDLSTTGPTAEPVLEEKALHYASGHEASKPKPSVAPSQINTTGKDAMSSIVQNLGVLQHKINKNTAYLGVLIGFAIFAFSLFLSWANIPAGMMAKDGGASNGWSELAFLALLPLGFALYPVFLNRSVSLNSLLTNIAISFGLLGYNNIINRSAWHNAYGNMGSVMGAGFWIGLLAMVAISACGISWALHTTDGDGDASTEKHGSPN